MFVLCGNRTHDPSATGRITTTAPIRQSGHHYRTLSGTTFFSYVSFIRKQRSVRSRDEIARANTNNAAGQSPEAPSVNFELRVGKQRASDVWHNSVAN
ncbi:hypothetical protein EVAR_46937_1 [Eumeta japonica]|uniref:Uncharacterized protein n=1 Tax=Eumeta variegata TaxID=151549 RepID=A0A4C1ZXN4_EUMVA|nr:hypothetical protein EVAR_46937_1 [Eumeta japonica]